MSFQNIPIRSGDDLNSSTDVNQLMENIRVISGNGTLAPEKTMMELKDEVTELQLDTTELKNLYLRKSVIRIDDRNFSFGTGWVKTLEFDEILDFKANSKIKMFYHVPCRNDSTSWGGVYLEPQISFDSGVTWQSLGSSGYDGGVMNIGQSIGSYSNVLLIDPAIASDFSVSVRFYSRTYDGIGTIHVSNDMNHISGTALLMDGTNGLLHYAHIIIEELATGD